MEYIGMKRYMMHCGFIAPQCTTTNATPAEHPWYKDHLAIIYSKANNEVLALIEPPLKKYRRNSLVARFS